MRAKELFDAEAKRAARTGEVIVARWSEFDLAEGVWTVPADRMKAGRVHRVPLAPRVIEILKSIKRSGEFVFTYRGKPISNAAQWSQTIQGMRERLDRGR
jgi:integrase